MEPGRPRFPSKPVQIRRASAWSLQREALSSMPDRRSKGDMRRSWAKVTPFLFMRRVLINRLKRDFPGARENIRLLDQVNLMTPENIHLNSFMYEPILDLSVQHLRAADWHS